jgi:hypothetical protein
LTFDVDGDETIKERKKKKGKRKKRIGIRFSRIVSQHEAYKEGDARIEGASTRAETKKKRQRRGREKECPV